VTVAGAGGRREATKQANRAAILDAAREVFADLGFGAATVRDIVRATPLATGTFYNYFPDKETVFRALIDQLAGEARARLRAARASARTVDEFVESGFRAYFSFLAEDRVTFLLVGRNAGTIRGMFDTPALGAGSDELAADLRAGIAAGSIPHHDVDLMAAAMVGAGFELGVRLLDAEPPDVEGATRFATEFFLGGLERLGRASTRF